MEPLMLPGQVAPPAYVPPAPEPVKVRELWRMVKRHRLLIGACAAVGLALGLLLVARSRPEYQATAKILVDDNRERVARVLGTEVTDEKGRMATEMELLRSRQLARAVADSLELRVAVVKPEGVPRSQVLSDIRLGAEADTGTITFVKQPYGEFEARDAAGRVIGRTSAGTPMQLAGGQLVLAPEAVDHEEFTVAIGTREGAAEAVADQLDVSQPAEEANVVYVTYRSSDPALARDVPNTLAARFMEMRRDVHGTEARSTVQFLRAQVDTLRGQLTAAEQRLQGFREREGVVALPVEASTQVTQQAQLQAQRNALEAERSALARSIAQARSSTGPGASSPYRNLTAFPTLLRNETATQLITQIAQLENERSAKMQTRTAEDPDVQGLTRRIEQLEGQLGGIVNTYVQGLGNQVASIDASLGSFGARMDRIPAQEVELARLSRQTEVLGGLYGQLQARLKEAEVAEAVDDPGVRVMDPAPLPSEPSNGGTPLVAGVLALFGLLLGVGIAFAREYADVSVHTRDDLQAATGFPVLGWVPRMGASVSPAKKALGGVRKILRPGRAADSHAGRALVPTAGVASLMPSLPAGAPTATADAYEWLYRNLLFLKPGEDVRAVLVTSPLPGDGKTTTAAGLAATLAQRGLRVLLVDADLRRGAPAPQGGGGTPGLSDLLAGTVPLADVVQLVNVGEGRQLHYIPAGHLPPDPVQLLGSPRIQVLMEWLREKYFIVVLDSPPLNLFADAAVLASCADATLLVARAGVTPFEAVVHAAEQCRRARMPTVGTVLNDIVPDRDRDYDPAYRWYEEGRAYYARVA
jgi:capsular exopolysaccharide synthesis family protein